MGYLARAQLNNEVFPVNCSRCTPLSDGHLLAGYDAQCQLRDVKIHYCDPSLAVDVGLVTQQTLPP